MFFKIILSPKNFILKESSVKKFFVIDWLAEGFSSYQQV